jgi:two-component system NtrC family response regulator
MADGGRIGRDDLGLSGPAETPESAAQSRSFDLRAVRDAAERGAVIAALAHTNGNIAKAAELLGISRPTLYDLMHRLAIQ